MEDIDDDFGELYADVEVQASSAINGGPDFTPLHTQQQHDNDNNNNIGGKSLDESHLIKNDSRLGGDERRENDSEAGNDGDNEAGVEVGSDTDSDSDDDDDFDIVVNDDDFGAKNGGGDGRGFGEAVKDEEDEFVAAVKEGNSMGKTQMWVDSGGMEQRGSGYGGERENVVKNGCNSQYKYARQYGSSIFTGNQRSISSRRDDREDFGYIQHKRSTLGRVGPSYAGYVSGSAEHGNSFWLPWYRSILDVDIDTFEQKPWTLSGADVTDYFNFGFDEKSWKSYCQSVDQIRQQNLMQSRNQVYASLRSKLENEAAAPEEIEAEVGQESIPNGPGRLTSQDSEYSMRQLKRQIGRAIHVEDSNTERQPTMDARPPRIRDSDVVIEINVQDSEASSSSGKEDPDDMLETKKGDQYSHENVELETTNCAHSKPREMATNSAEENIQSPSASSDLKRSYESATGSSHMLQDSSSQGKGHNSDSDALRSGKGHVFSRGNAGAVETLDASMEDTDINTAEANPCVAGIDSLSDDRLQSSPATSDNIRSEASSDRYRCDFQRTQDSQRSSADSVMEGRASDCHVSRQSDRDVVVMKAGGCKYGPRVRNSIEEDWKHHPREVRRHSKLNSPGDEDENYRFGVRGHVYSRDRLRAHRSKERVHASHSHDEDWPNHRRKVSSLGYYGKRSGENRVQAAYINQSHLEQWRSGDERDLYLQREWEDEELFSERRIRRTEGDIAEREWYLHEKECVVRELRLQDQPHFISKYSSVDIEWSNQPRVHDDVHFRKRSPNDLSIEYRYSDGPALDRYARSHILNDRENEYLDSDIKCERRLRHLGREVATSGRGDQYLDNPSLDLDYQCNIRDDDKYLHRESSLSTHYDHNRHPVYTERRHDSTFYREDVDGPRVFQKHGRHGRYISLQDCRDDRDRFYDHRDACDRRDTFEYLNEDNYIGKKLNVDRYKGMDWTEDAVFYRSFSSDYKEDKLGSFKGVSKHKRHGTKHGFFPTQYMKHKQRILKGGDGGGGKPCNASSKMPTRVEHEQTGLWCRNSVEFRHVVGKRKSTGKCSKAGRDMDNARATTDGGIHKPKKTQQEVVESGTKKVMENQTPNVEALRRNIPITNQDDNTDLEEGQIPTAEACTEILKKKKCGPGQVVPNSSLKRTPHNQELVRQNDICAVYDENRILETMAKMEKRRERFKEPMLLKKDKDSDPKTIETAESKQQRPARKRRWDGS